MGKRKQLEERLEKILKEQDDLAKDYGKIVMDNLDFVDGTKEFEKWLKEEKEMLNESFSMFLNRGELEKDLDDLVLMDEEELDEVKRENPFND